MRLSWNEMRSRAVAFSEEWKDAAYEKGESQPFYDDFFEIFGIKRRQVARYEESVKKLDNRQGFIDLFWPGVLLAEQKSAGRDLDKAAEQAGEYFDALPDEEKPRYQLVCDFQNFHLLDRDERQKTQFPLAELSANLEAFKFMLGEDSGAYEEQKELSIDASRLMGRIHDDLDKSGYKGKRLEIFLTRLTFCMFADNTGIFEKRLFQDLLKRKRDIDMGAWIGLIFETLNKPENERQTILDEDMAKLPYVNGGLFEDQIDITALDKTIRENLIYVADFKWHKISPAIFGSMFQSIMNEKERREQGAHYTGEIDILKVIDSLFMDDLWRTFKKFKKIKTKDSRDRELKVFHDQLADMTFFDPACGCGNFLVIAYRELRRLEIEVLELIHTDSSGKLQIKLDAHELSKIDVHQFYGLELNDFAVHIARSALWMMDHFMNIELGKKFGQWIPRIPLEKSPTIICADALEMDWAELLPPEKCSFIFGNPPFGGAKTQSQHQREQVRKIANLGGSGGTLDYVCAWYIKAGHYIQGKTGIGFVSTNSITQGEQVAQLWPILLEQCDLEIAFAHKSFAWESEAPGQATVTVIIIGLEKKQHARKDKVLFFYEDLKGKPTAEPVLAISPYLFDTSLSENPNIVIKETNKSLNGLPKMIIGTKPIDGGYYILNKTEKEDLLSKEPKAFPYIHPYIGAREFLQGSYRYIINAPAILDSEFKKLPLIKKIRTQVKEYRLGKIPAKGKSLDSIKPPGMSALKLAETPTAFHVTSIPTAPFLVIPETTSDAREYIPIAVFDPPVIPSNAIRYIADATLADFALLTSAMHMAWMRTVAGRLGNGYRYSIGVVYNTFPLPKGANLSKLESYGQAILDARLDALKKDPKATLADLYDRDGMQPNLRRAHKANDDAVDKLYATEKFADDTARINHLFALYEKQTT